MNIVTLIPAYKPDYFEYALLSLSAQTTKPQLVVVSDDTKDGLFINLAQKNIYSHLGLNIHFIDGPKIGGVANINRLLDFGRLIECDLYHFLFDDDFIFPNFYEMHKHSFALNKDAQCSISKRYYSNELGQPLGPGAYPADINQLHSKFFTIPIEYSINKAVLAVNNFYGEFSNAVFKKDILLNGLPTNFGGVDYFGLEDIGTFLNASQHKPLAFINEYLSCFRQNPYQNTAKINSKVYKDSWFAWGSLLFGAYNLGFATFDQIQNPLKGFVQLYIKNHPFSEEVYFLNDFLGLIDSKEINEAMFIFEQIRNLSK